MTGRSRTPRPGLTFFGDRISDAKVNGHGVGRITDGLVLTDRVEEIQALVPEGDAFTAAICGAVLTLGAIKVRDAVVVAKPVCLAVGPARAIQVVDAKIFTQAIFRAEGSLWAIQVGGAELVACAVKVAEVAGGAVQVGATRGVLIAVAVLATEEAVWTVEVRGAARILLEADAVMTKEEPVWTVEVRGAAWLFVTKAVLSAIKAQGTAGVVDTICGAKAVEVTEGIAVAVLVTLASSHAISRIHLADVVQRAVTVAITSTVINRSTLHNQQ